MYVSYRMRREEIEGSQHKKLTFQDEDITYTDLIIIHCIRVLSYQL